MNALQNGEVILSLLVSFNVDKEGREFQESELPTVPPPDEIPEQEIGGHNTMFDLRPGRPEARRRSKWPGLSHRFWARTRGAVARRPADPRVRAHLSLRHGDRVHEGADATSRWAARASTTRVWFHRPVRMDEWVLVDLEPRRGVRFARVLHRRVLRPDGQLVATLTQEHLMIPRTFADRVPAARIRSRDQITPSARSAAQLVVGETELADEHVVVVLAQTRRRAARVAARPSKWSGGVGARSVPTPGLSYSVHPPVASRCASSPRSSAEFTGATVMPAPLRLLEERLLRVPRRQPFDPEVDRARRSGCARHRRAARTPSDVISSTPVSSRIHSASVRQCSGMYATMLTAPSCVA